MNEIVIEPVDNAAGLREFIDVQDRICRDERAWVRPLIIERLEHYDPKKNLLLGNMEHRFWLARRGGEPVGRVSAQVNKAHLAVHHDACGQFGSFDCIDDPAVAKALLDTAFDWLKERGMRQVTGPFTHGINEESGVLVDGFDTPPMIMMPHNPPWYDRLLQGYGLEPADDLICFEFQIAPPPAPRIQRIIDRFEANARLRVRTLDKSRYQADIDIVCDVFNDAWKNNFGFIPFGQEEARYLARSLKPVIDPGTVLIAELDGEPVGMMIAIPNVNEAARDLDGRLLPFGWAKLLWRLKVRTTRGWRVPLMGIRESVQNSALGAQVAFGLIETLRRAGFARGVDWAELSWILKSNERMIGIIQSVGGVPYKTYRIYQRTLD